MRQEMHLASSLCQLGQNFAFKSGDGQPPAGGEQDSTVPNAQKINISGCDGSNLQDAPPTACLWHYLHSWDFFHMTDFPTIMFSVRLTFFSQNVSSLGILNLA